MDGIPCRGVVELIHDGRSELCVIDPLATRDSIVTRGLKQTVGGSLDITIHARAGTGTVHTLLTACTGVDHCRVWWMTQDGAERAKYCSNRFEDYPKVDLGMPKKCQNLTSMYKSMHFPVCAVNGVNTVNSGHGYPHNVQYKGPTLTDKGPTSTNGDVALNIVDLTGKGPTLTDEGVTLDGLNTVNPVNTVNPIGHVSKGPTLTDEGPAPGPSGVGPDTVDTVNTVNTVYGLNTVNPINLINTVNTVNDLGIPKSPVHDGVTSDPDGIGPNDPGIPGSPVHDGPWSIIPDVPIVCSDGHSPVRMYCGDGLTGVTPRTDPTFDNGPKKRLTLMSSLEDFANGGLARPVAETREDPWGPSPVHPECTEVPSTMRPGPWTVTACDLPRPCVPEPPSLAYVAWLAWPERDTSPTWAVTGATGRDVTLTAWTEGGAVTVAAEGSDVCPLPWLTLVTAETMGPLAGALMSVRATGRKVTAPGW